MGRGWFERGEHFMEYRANRFRVMRRNRRQWSPCKLEEVEPFIAAEMQHTYQISSTSTEA